MNKTGDVSNPLIAVLGQYWLVDQDFARTAEGIANSLTAADIAKLQADFEAKLKAEQEQHAKLVEAYNDSMKDASTKGTVEKPRRFKLADGNAQISLIGPMTKRPSCMAMLFGGGSASTLLTEMAIRDAIADPEVTDITLYIETPGGEVSGAFDLADTVYRAKKKKPIYAYISDQATSGGMLVASQATRVFANSNALTGSIGVYTTLVDQSERLKQAGVKVILVKAGEFKGVGVSGVPINQAQIATVQERIDSFHQLFTKAVARGRMMSKEEIAAVSDAQVFVGAQAIKYGLVDEIASFDTALSMARSGKGRVRTKETTMQVDDATDKVDLGDDVSLIVESQVTDDNGGGDDKIVVPPAASDKIELTPAIWAAVAAHVGVEAKAENVAEAVATFVKAGQSYDKNLRDAAIKMSVVAGYGDMSNFISGIPLDNVLAHLKSATQVARSKGLVGDGSRQTAASEVAGDVTTKKPVAADGKQATVKDGEEDTNPVQRNLAVLRESGIYTGL